MSDQESKKKRGQRRTLAMFDDVKQVLDQAVAAGGGSVKLADDGKATHWRHRAYTFRKMYAETVEWSPYDRLTLRKVIPGTGTVTIDVIKQDAIFTPAEAGIPITPQPKAALRKPAAKPAPQLDPDLLATATEFAESLKKDIL